MSFWDPYDRYGREQRRRLEARRRAEEEARRRAMEQEAIRRAMAEREGAQRAQPPLPPGLQARIEEALARLTQERDEWRDRYSQLAREVEARQSQLAEERRALEAARAQLAEERRAWEAAQQAAPPPSPTGLAARFEEELAQAMRERDEWRDRYTQAGHEVAAERARLAEERAASEAALRERLTRNAQQRAFSENRQTLSRLLEVADNFERILAQGDDASPLAEGVRLTYRDFRRALEQVGVERVTSVGEPFDPALHEAVATVPSEAAAGTVVEELAPGYRYQGNLLRPARVVIAE